VPLADACKERRETVRLAETTRKPHVRVRRTCQVCRVEFMGRSDARFCGVSCRGKARPKPQPSPITCVVCGNSAVSIRGKTCSRECRWAMRHPLASARELNCRECGRSFAPPRSDNKGYCSRRCSRIYRSKQEGIACERCGVHVSRKHSTRGRFCGDECAALIAIRPCIQCGETFLPARSDHTLCSDACRKAKARDRQVERAISHRIGKPKGRCAECDEAIESQGRSLFCSDRCSHKSSKRMRRVKLRAARIEPVGLKALIRRDRGTCQICKHPVNQAAVVPAFDAATIDHVVPLARGGEHSYANCQLACFRCNYTKSDNTPTVGCQMIMF